MIKAKVKFIIVSGIVVLCLFLASQAKAATYWVNDPSDCLVQDESVFAGQRCYDGKKICGDADGTATCYFTDTLLPPNHDASSLNSGVNQPLLGGGYVVNCYAEADNPTNLEDAQCDNSTNFWCNPATSCETEHRTTTCIADFFAKDGASAFDCGSCKTNWADCNADGGDCEVNFNVTVSTTHDNTKYASTCDTLQCVSGWSDCVGGGDGTGNDLDGCETLIGDVCTTDQGAPGTIANCICVAGVQNFRTGIEALFATSSPFLWGINYGDGDLIKFGNRTSTDVFAVSNDGVVKISTTTAPVNSSDRLYNIDGNLYWNGNDLSSGASLPTGLAGQTLVNDGISWTATDTLFVSSSGFVGIGTTTPEFKLTMDNDAGIAAFGTYGSGAVLPYSGAGSKLLWYPRKAAFRAGYVSGDGWDDANIGDHSVAMGQNARATNAHAIALGAEAAATGFSSLAFGWSAQASSNQAVAIGHSAVASNMGALALSSSGSGSGAEASGLESIAIGKVNVSGSQSIGLGYGGFFDEITDSNVMSILGVNVGIGATSSAYALSVVGDIDVSGTYSINGTDYGQHFIDSEGVSGTLWMSDGVGRGYWTQTSSLGIAGLPTGSAGQTLVSVGGSTWNATNSLFVSSVGNIGIGTTSPASKMHISDGTLLVDEPRSLSLYGSYLSGTGASGQSVAISGKYAYFAYGTDGLRILDISDPSNPRAVGQYDPGSVYTVEVSGKYAYIHASTGFQILDISNPSSITLLSTMGLGGLGRQIAISGKYAYLCRTSNSMAIIDISNPSLPRLATTYAGGNPVGISISGKYAYVADNANGLTILDVSNPEAPSYVSSYAPGGNANSVYVSGGNVYISIAGNLNIIDVSNPALPVGLSTTSIDTASPGVKVYGKYAYVAGSTFGLRVVDVSSSTAARVISSYDTGSQVANAVTVVGKFAYVSYGANGLHVVNLGGADINAAKIGAIESNNLTIWENANIGNNVFVKNNLNVGSGMLLGGAFNMSVSSTNSNLNIFGVSISSTASNNHPAFVILDNGNIGIGTSTPQTLLTVAGTSTLQNVLPMLPYAGNMSAYNLGASAARWNEVWAGTYNVGTSTWSLTTTGTGRFGIFDGASGVGNERLSILSTGYVGIGTSSPREKLHLYDGSLLVDSPNNPTLKGYYYSPSLTSAYYSIAVSRGYAYMAYGSDGLRIIDIANPSAPSPVGQFSNGFSANGLDVAGNYAYVGMAGSGLKIIDVSDASNPKQVGSFSPGGTAYNVNISGKYAFVAFSSAGLRIVDVSNPNSPVQVGVYDPPSNVYSVFVSGNFAYLACSDGFKILDISNITSPILVSEDLGGFTANNAYVSGKYAYVTYNNTVTSSLRIFDISSPSLPIATSSVGLGGNGYAVKISGKYAYVGGGVAGLKIVDISDVANPAVIGTYDANGTNYAYGVDVSGKYAFVSYGTSGLRVVDLLGADISNANIGSIQTNDLTAWEDARIGNNLYINGGLNVGYGGVLSRGNFGMFSSSTGNNLNIFNISVSTTASNNYPALTVTDNGYVGVGTSSPIYDFEIGNDNRVTTATLRLIAAANTDSQIKLMEQDDNYGFSIIHSAGPNKLSVVSSYGVSQEKEVLTILNDGRTGIGTSSPLYDLDVGYSEKNTKTALRLMSNNDTEIRMMSVNDSVGFRFWNDSSENHLYLMGDNSSGFDTIPITVDRFWGSVGIGIGQRDPLGTFEVEGSVILDLNGVGSVEALCHNTSATTDQEIVDCSGTPEADYMEMYAMDDGLEKGDVVALSDLFVTTKDGKKVPKLVKSSLAYNSKVIGVVSNKDGAGDFNSVGHNIKDEDNKLPLALSGRVLVKVSTINGLIRQGDRLTSSDIPGVAMKATEEGPTVGIAMEDYIESDIGTILTFVNVGWNNNLYRGLSLDTNSSSIFVGSASGRINLNLNGALSMLGSELNKLSFSSSTLFESSVDKYNGSNAFIFNALNFSSSSNSSFLLSLRSNNQPVFSVASNGDVQAIGDIHAKSLVAGHPGQPGDLAERVDIAVDDVVEPGDVLIVDEISPDTYRRSRGDYAQSVAGVVSTNPTIVVGNGRTDYTAVMAMVGRVPVKVSSENGAINRGDLLVTASTTGYAMKYDSSKDNGLKIVGVIGVALEPMVEGSGKILALIRTGWVNNRSESIATLKQNVQTLASLQGIDLTNSITTTLNVGIQTGSLTYNGGDLDLQSFSLLNVKSIIGNKWSIDENGLFITRLETSVGTKEMYAMQSPDLEFVFSSSSQLGGGQVSVEFDQQTQEIIDFSKPLKISVTLTSGEAKGIYVSEKNATGFIVKELESGSSNATFDWMVVAKRKSFSSQIEESSQVILLQDQPVIPIEQPINSGTEGMITTTETVISPELQPTTMSSPLQESVSDETEEVVISEATTVQPATLVEVSPIEKIEPAEGIETTTSEESSPGA